MNNNNGFTLVELLAIIIVLSITTILIVPSVIGAVDASKEEGTISIATLAVLKAKTYVLNNENFSVPASSNQVKLITFSELGVKSTKTTYGETIDQNNSYVLVDNNNNYYVTITTAVGAKGIKNTIDTKLTEDYTPLITFESDNSNNLGVPNVSAFSIGSETLNLDTTGNGKADSTATLIEIRN